MPLKILIIIFSLVGSMSLSDCRHDDLRGHGYYHPYHCSPKDFCVMYRSLEGMKSRPSSSYEARLRASHNFSKFVEANKSRKLVCNLNSVKAAPIKSKLQMRFEEYTKVQRQQMQSILESYGFYKSNIDGIFGKNTKLALEKYNQQFLGNSDLSSNDNIDKLFSELLNSANKKVSDKSKELEKLNEIETRFGLSFYGSFLHTNKVPNALFFLNEIKPNDRFEFRKALRSHDISYVVLSSLGGSVWEGLSMAAIINDRQLDTYVPETGVLGQSNCASACSFMFLAGSKRRANGRLGVHQFYSSDASKKDKIGEVQETTQFTVSEIIGYLNEFGTPSWVFERMFQQTEMYYFKEDEIEILETEIPQDLELDFENAETFLVEFAKAIEKTVN